MGKKKYKYKREDFETQAQFDAFRQRSAQAKLRWLEKCEKLNPEHRERRLLWQRLYSRYYYRHTNEMTFQDFLKTEYGIEDRSKITVEELRRIMVS